MIRRAFPLAVLLLLGTLFAPGMGAALAAPAEPGMWIPSAAPPPAPVLSTLLVPPAGAPAVAAPRVNVAIQAGHWKSDELPDALARLRGSTGASGGGRTEAQVTLDIAQRVVRQLRAKGLTAEVLPATVPTGYAADLFISLHADGNASTRPRGYKVSTRWRSDVAAFDAVLVQAIEDGYSQTTGMPQDPSVTRAMRGYYAYSTYRGEAYRIGATTPAAILEMGFMSNATDRGLMFNSPDLLARGVVAGIDNFYARRADAARLQAAAERQAAASPYNRSAVILTDSANIRGAGSSDAPRLAGAGFGDSFAMLQATTPRPSGGFDPRQGTQLVTGSGWYQIDLPDTPADAYSSRDVVGVQQ
jgi:N-acetylmuramoyl-L-alanine amidase